MMSITMYVHKFTKLQCAKDLFRHGVYDNVSGHPFLFVVTRYIYLSTPL